MAKFTCKCGEQLSNSSVPNEIELHVYTWFEWDEILRNDVVETWKIPSPGYDVWKCPHCERIYFFDKQGNVIKRYKLEDE